MAIKARRIIPDIARAISGTGRGQSTREGEPINPKGEDGESDPKAQHGCAGRPACSGALTQLGPSVVSARGNPLKEGDLNPRGGVGEERQLTSARHAQSMAPHNSEVTGPSPWKSLLPSRSS